MEQIIEVVKKIASKSDLIDIIRIEEVPFSVEGMEQGIYTDIVVFNFDCETKSTIYYFLAEIVNYLPTIETKIVSYTADNNIAHASVEICYIK